MNGLTGSKTQAHALLTQERLGPNEHRERDGLRRSMPGVAAMQAANSRKAADGELLSGRCSAGRPTETPCRVRDGCGRDGSTRLAEQPMRVSPAEDHDGLKEFPPDGTDEALRQRRSATGTGSQYEWAQRSSTRAWPRRWNQRFGRVKDELSRRSLEREGLA
jgi:hypothetical protein